MYKHITMNSVFNFIYCNLTLLRLMNVCVFETSMFCSSISTYESTQYFRIIFIYYIGNIIKLCCNISYISFSISRFTLSANNKSRFLLKFENINLKRVPKITRGPQKRRELSKTPRAWLRGAVARSPRSKSTLRVRLHTSSYQASYE